MASPVVQTSVKNDECITQNTYFQKHAKQRTMERSIRRAPFASPPGEALNFQVLADWLEGAPAWPPRNVHQLKLNNPYRSFTHPFAKSIVLPSVFHTFAIEPPEGGSRKRALPPGRADSFLEIDFKMSTLSQKSNAKASLIFLPGPAEEQRCDLRSKSDQQNLQNCQPSR